MISTLKRGKVNNSSNITRERLVAVDPKKTPGSRKRIVAKGDWTKSNPRTVDGATNKIVEALRKSKRLLRINGDVEDPGEEE